MGKKRGRAFFGNGKKPFNHNGLSEIILHPGAGAGAADRGPMPRLMFGGVPWSDTAVTELPGLGEFW